MKVFYYSYMSATWWRSIQAKQLSTEQKQIITVKNRKKKSDFIYELSCIPGFRSVNSVLLKLFMAYWLFLNSKIKPNNWLNFHFFFFLREKTKDGERERER